MKIMEVRHTGVSIVEADTPLRAVAKRMRDEDIGAVPVRAGGEIVGLITDRDIACRAVAGERDVSQLTARDVMTPSPTSCSPDDEVEAVLELMEAKQIRRIPVLDEARRPVGMLSLGDLCQRLPTRTAGDVLRTVAAHHR
jgi:CBS domain-containing protein